jgi:hypothetical protein
VTRRLLLVASWLLAGHLLWLGLFWLLLQVPESTVFTLVVSAILTVLLIVIGGAVHAGASAWWHGDPAAGHPLLRGARRPHAGLLGAALFGVVWWATAWLLAWHDGAAGQIDALYIARTGRADTRWIHSGMFWAVMFVRWSLGLTMAVCLLAAVVIDGVRAAGGGGWLRAALSPRQWLAVTFWLVLLVAIPWHLVSWRPQRLSVAAEPWFVSGKLALVALAMSAGWALVLRTGHGGYRSSIHVTPSPSARDTQAAASP